MPQAAPRRARMAGERALGAGRIARARRPPNRLLWSRPRTARTLRGMAALVIALGGALGTLARYELGLLLARRLGAAFPYGTLAVNLIGSFLIGVIAQAFAGATVLGVDARL